jgi:hypothetical protein
MLCSVNQIWIHNEGSPKSNYDVFIWMPLDRLARCVRCITPIDEECSFPSLVCKIKILSAVDRRAATNARFDQMDVADTNILQLVNHIRKLRNRILHPHAKCAPRAHAVTHAHRNNGICNSLYSLIGEALSIVYVPTILIVSLIRDILDKLVMEKTIVTIQLDTAKFSFHSVPCSFHEVLHNFSDLVDGHNFYNRRAF